MRKKEKGRYRSKTYIHSREKKKSSVIDKKKKKGKRKIEKSPRFCVL